MCGVIFVNDSIIVSVSGSFDNSVGIILVGGVLCIVDCNVDSVSGNGVVNNSCSFVIINIGGKFDVGIISIDVVVLGGDG